MIPDELTRARRLALGAMLAEGGIPQPWQFTRAGLPPLFTAAELAARADARAAEVDRELAATRPARRKRSKGPQF